MITINTALWQWPQWVILIIMVFNLFAQGMKHGQERDNYNVGWAVIDFTCFGAILVCGGFFA